MAVTVTTSGLRETGQPASTLPEVNWAVATGTADVLVAAYTPANTALTDGLILGARIGTTNATTSPTFNPDGLGAHTIVKDGGSALAVGDLVVLGEALFRYNLANTRWELLNPMAPPSAAVVSTAPLPYVAAQVNDNLHLANDTTTPNDKITVTAGRVRDDADSTNMVLVATLFKSLAVAWAAGGATTGASGGACDTGTKGNSQTWHIFAIGKINMVPTLIARTSNVATVTVAAHTVGVGSTVRVSNLGAGFDTSGAAVTAVTTNTISYANTGSNVSSSSVTGSPTVDAFDVIAGQTIGTVTMPTGWTVKQRLGSVMSSSAAAIFPFTQIADYFLWTAIKADFTSINVGATQGARVLKTLTVPLGLKVEADMMVSISTNTNGGVAYLLITSPDQTDVAAATNSASYASNMTTTTMVFTYQCRRLTNTSGQVGQRCQGDSNLLYSINTLGYRDPGRRMF